MFSLGQGSERGLAEADSAVVRRNGVIRPDLQSRRLQEVLEIAQEKRILKNAAGKHNCVDSLRETERCDSIT